MKPWCKGRAKGWGTPAHFVVAPHNILLHNFMDVGKNTTMNMPIAKKSLFSLIFILSSLVIVTDSPATIIFKMNHQFQASTTGSKIDQWFADEIQRATGGEVEIRIFWANRLGEPRENLRLLKNGDIDMAAMSAGYFPDKLALHAAPNSLPMAMDNICQSSAIMKALLTRVPAFAEESTRNKIRPLFFHLLNPYLLVTKEPVTTVSQLNGMRIRTWGEDMPRLVQAAGGTPVTLFLPDIYEAMKRGVIDACPFSVDLVMAYKIYELAGHITEVVLWEGPGWGIWIGEDAWKKLPPRFQAIFLETAEKARQKEIPLTLAAARDAREFLLSRGVRFHPFPAAELARWRTASPDFFADLVTRLSQTGHDEAVRQTVQIWQEMRQRIACP